VKAGGDGEFPHTNTGIFGNRLKSSTERERAWLVGGGRGVEGNRSLRRSEKLQGAFGSAGTSQGYGLVWGRC
jgi:hypothetical protein